MSKANVHTCHPLSCERLFGVMAGVLSFGFEQLSRLPRCRGFGDCPSDKDKCSSELGNKTDSLCKPGSKPGRGIGQDQALQHGACLSISAGGSWGFV